MPSNASPRLAIKKATKKVKSGFRRVKARLSHHQKTESVQSDSDSDSRQSGSNHSSEGSSRRHSHGHGPLTPLLNHLARSLSPIIVVTPDVPIFPFVPLPCSPSMEATKFVRERTESTVSTLGRDDYFSSGLSATEDESMLAGPPGVPEHLQPVEEAPAMEDAVAGETGEDEAQAVEEELPDASTSPTGAVDEVSPPASEPETPAPEGDLDPFLIDDPDEPEPVTPVPAPRPSISDTTFPAADSEVTLSTLPSAPLVEVTVDVNKPVPAPPSPSSDTESEPDVPAVYLPQLVLPTMFLPIPNTDPLTTLLTKYISNPERRPPRDLSGEWTRTDFHTLVMTHSWRALARMARDRLIQADPEDLPIVFSLWYLRLSSLARLRLFNQTSAESTNLFTALSSIQVSAARAHVFDNLLPFELEVLHARVSYWAGDPDAYADALAGLMRKCRKRARAARNEGERGMWRERAARVGLIAASLFVERKDFAAAAALLEPLLAQPSFPPAPALRSALARIYLQSGQLAAAEKLFEMNAQDPSVESAAKELDRAFLEAARGEWESVVGRLKGVVQEDAENYAAVNNLAVALLSEGKIKEGIEVLEAALRTAPAALAMAEPFLFNLSTLYELRSAVAADKKRDLLVEVAKWSGDGLRTTCLKMPAN